MIGNNFLSQENIKDKYYWIFITYIVSCFGYLAPSIWAWGEKLSNFKRVVGMSTLYDRDISKVISNYYIYLFLMGLLFICSIFIVNFVRKKFNYNNDQECWRVFNHILVLGVCVNIFSIFNTSLNIRLLQPSAICLIFLIIELFFIKKPIEINQKKIHQILISSLSLAAIFSIFFGNARFTYLLLFFLFYSFSLIKVQICSLKNNRLKSFTDSILMASIIGGIITSVSIEINYILINKGYTVDFSNQLFLICTLLLVFALSFIVSTQKRIKEFLFNYLELFILFGFSLLSNQMPYFINVSNIEMFELANSSVLISDFLNYGDIPIIQHYGGHMLTKVIEGIFYGLITGDYYGAIYSPYSSYLIQTLSVPLSFWFIKQIIKDDYISFLTVLLFPLSSFIPSYYVLGLSVFIFAQKYIKEPSSLNAISLFLISFFICCYRLDLGVAFVLGALLSILFFSIRDSIIKIKNLAICWVVGSIIVFITWYILCIYKGIDPLLRLKEFIEISDSNQNWGYITIGSSQNESFVFVYVILPCVVTIALVYEIIKQFTKKTTSEFAFLFVCLGLTYLCNVPRTLTRHSLVEYSYHTVISTGIMCICVYIASKIKDKVFFLFAIAGMIFCVNSWKNVQLFDAALFSDLIQNKPAKTWETIKNSNKLEQRVIENDNILEKKQKLGPILDLFLNQNETYLDFICHSNLYSYLGRRNPVYVAQSPIHLSGEFTQEQFVHQIKSNIQNIPIAILPRNYGEIYTTLDGVDNVIRYYKVSELIYQNYIPLCLAGEYAIWAEKSKYDDFHLIAENYLKEVTTKEIKSRIIDELSSYGYDSNSKFHKYNLVYLPYLWGEKDKRNAAYNNTIQEISNLDDKIDNSKAINGNYLKIVISSKTKGEFIAKFNTRNKGSNSDLFEYIFTLMEGTHSYLIRVSSDYFWYSCKDLYLKLLSPKGANIKEIKILEGD